MKSDQRYVQAEQIELNTYCALRQFGGSIVVYPSGETEWLDYANGITDDCCVVDWNDYTSNNNLRRAITDRIYCCLDTGRG